MSTFKTLKIATHQQFDKLAKHELFYTDVSKDTLWETYLAAFPEGTNPMFRERTEHDCNCCKQYIRACGSVVAIIDGELVSIWDVEVDEPYKTVANALSTLVKSKAIKNIYRHYEANLGTDLNHGEKYGDVTLWEHFHYKLPAKFIVKERAPQSIDQVKGNAEQNHSVLKRSVTEITREAINIVLDLINQNSLYRGSEHLGTVNTLLTASVHYEAAKNKETYLWLKAIQLGMGSRIRNSVIGTLLVDISNGVELETAVKSFETKVAPQNYKRPTALITQGMIDKAQNTVVELGYESALQRRNAVTEDITINNVLYADRTVKEAKGVFGDLKSTIADTVPNLDRVEEVSIQKFIEDILPKSESIELMVENEHSGNFMSLIAPVDLEAKQMFKWGNNFSWSYNGEVADSMKERVKAAGGDVTGKLRFSIQWNDGDNNQNDFDAHAREPNGNKIYFSNKVSSTSGRLDVDITTPGRKIAVENITWQRVPNGDYELSVHNYSHNGGMTGFTAEIAFNGKIHSYTYNKGLRQGEVVHVAKINIQGDKLTFNESLESTLASKEIWGVHTQKFQKVDMIMHSPNHWDGEETGNKHWFFILDQCNNPVASRGFYNEFLNNELTEHRKVFEVIGSKLKTEVTDKQLSGVGFSSTQKNHVLCKVSGSFNRVIKIKF